MQERHYSIANTLESVFLALTHQDDHGRIWWFPVFFAVILGRSHYVLFHLVSAMQPRMLVTFDEELRPLPISVRVGQVGRVWCEWITLMVLDCFSQHTFEFTFASCRDQWVSIFLYFSSPGCRCSRPSWQTQDDHRFPDPHHSSIAGIRREGRAGHRRMYPFLKTWILFLH